MPDSPATTRANVARLAIGGVLLLAPLIGAAALFWRDPDWLQATGFLVGARVYAVWPRFMSLAVGAGVGAFALRSLGALPGVGRCLGPLPQAALYGAAMAAAGAIAGGGQALLFGWAAAVVYAASFGPDSVARPALRPALWGAASCLFALLVGAAQTYRAQRGESLCWMGVQPIDLHDFLHDAGWLIASAGIAWLGPPASVGLRALSTPAALRFSAALIGLPALALGAVTAYTPPLSPGVVLRVAQPGLLWIEPDAKNNRLLVAKDYPLQRGDDVCVLYAVPTDPIRPIAAAYLPSVQLNGVQVDDARREVYHFNPGDATRGKPLTLLVFDADTLAVKRSQPIHAACAGWAGGLLLPHANRFFLICPDDRYLAIINRDSLQTERLLTDFPESWFAHDAEDRYFYWADNRDRSINQLDAHTLERVGQARGPRVMDRLFVANGGRKLFVPAGLEGEIWVYALPELRLMRRIPSAFGVRTLAVDDASGLMVTANYFNGWAETYDLKVDRTLRRTYVGKYVRTIWLDTRRRTAYVVVAHRGLLTFSY